MSDDGGDADQWAFSEWRDWAEGRHRRDSETVLPHAGDVTDGSARRTMSKVRGAFERSAERGWLGDGWPSKAEETETMRSIRTYHRTERAAEAIEHGEGSALRAMVGSQEDEPDVSGIRMLRMFEEMIDQPAFMLYIFGHMGTGKSFFASLIAEIWADLQGERAMVASNTRTIDAAEWISSWSELDEWMVEDEDAVMNDNLPPKLFIFDEASSVASGRGSDGWEASTKLAAMCYKIRKYGGALIVIGHDGKDVTPAVREMCTVFEKTGTKTGQFFRDVVNRSGREPLTPPLEGIPMPDKSWRPHTKDTAEWTWTDADGDGVERSEYYTEMLIYQTVQLREEERSVRETAEIVGKSTGWVSEKYNEYQDGGEAAEAVNTVREVIA